MMGLLSLTVRAQVATLSEEPTHNCCHVEWADTEAAAARRAKAVFMVNDGVRLTVFGKNERWSKLKSESPAMSVQKSSQTTGNLFSYLSSP